jgi:HemY protein
MRRLLAYVSILALLIAAALWLADRPGGVVLEWQDWQAETTVPVLLAAVLLFGVVIHVLLSLFAFLRGAPSAFGRSWRERREKKGLEALTRGLVAIASGDAQEARKQAREADKLLNRPALSLLLNAQAAQLSSDRDGAARQFEAMLGTPETEFVGRRGLIGLSVEKGDRAKALEHARQAYALKPDAEWVAEGLFDLLAKASLWQEALEVAERAQKRGLVERGQGRRQRALLLHLMSGTAETHEIRLKLASQSHELAAGFAPAAVTLAQLMAGEGKERKALSVLKDAWEAEPHPSLAKAALALDPGEDALRQVMKLEKLIASRPDHMESRIALAEANLAAKLWGAARNCLAPLLDDAPESRVCRLMAAIDEAERKPEASREWLVRAMDAPADPAWLCVKCGATAAAWSGLCPSCESFDSLVWGKPSRALRAIAPLADEPPPAIPMA